MSSRPAAGRPMTAAFLTRLARSVEGGPSSVHAPDPGEAAASLVRHLSAKLAEDDIEAVVSFLSNALDLAKADMRRERAQTSGSHGPDYWLG